MSDLLQQITHMLKLLFYYVVLVKFMVTLFLMMHKSIIIFFIFLLFVDKMTPKRKESESTPKKGRSKVVRLHSPLDELVVQDDEVEKDDKNEEREEEEGEEGEDDENEHEEEESFTRDPELRSKSQHDLNVNIDPNSPSTEEFVKTICIDNFLMRMQCDGATDLTSDCVVKSAMKNSLTHLEKYFENKNWMFILRTAALGNILICRRTIMLVSK